MDANAHGEKKHQLAHCRWNEPVAHANYDLTDSTSSPTGAFARTLPF
jgi:hypothetical protein